MRCSIHKDRPAQGACVLCGMLFCEGCLVEVDGKNYCKKHVAELVINNNSSTHSNKIHENHWYSHRNKTTCLLLCIFFGGWGVHRFYVGKIGTGVLYFFTGGFLFIGWAFDIITILRGNFRDSEGNYLK